MRIIASQPPHRRVEGSRRLSLLVEAAEVLLVPALFDDSSHPLAAPSVPVLAHELQRLWPLRRCPLHLSLGAEVQPVFRRLVG